MMNKAHLPALALASLTCVVGVRYLLRPRIVGTRDAVCTETQHLVVADRVAIWTKPDDDKEAGLCRRILWSFRRVLLDETAMLSCP